MGVDDPDGAQVALFGKWWVSVFPGLAVLLAVMAFGGIGRQRAGGSRRCSMSAALAGFPGAHLLEL